MEYEIFKFNDILQILRVIDSKRNGTDTTEYTRGSFFATFRTSTLSVNVSTQSQSENNEGASENKEH